MILAPVPQRDQLNRLLRRVELAARDFERAIDEMAGAVESLPVRRPSRRPLNIDWSSQPLGLEPDRAIAERLGCSGSAVYFARNRRGIAPARRTGRPRQTDPARIERLRHAYLDEGKTLEEVGVAEGITRERVRQLLSRAGVSFQSLEPCPACGAKMRAGKCRPCARRRPAREIRTCETCGGRVYRGRDGKFNSRCMDCRSRTRYQDDPEFQKIHLERCKAWRKKTLADPVKARRYRDRSNENSKRYRERRAALEAQS